MLITAGWPLANVYGQATNRSADVVRVATFNVSMNRSSAGALLEDLNSNDSQIANIARILREVAPDIVLLNEFDFEPGGRSVAVFQKQYLAPLHYPHVFVAPVNTGVPSGLDINKNGSNSDAADSFGFGKFPGQYGMVVLSKFPIRMDAVRTFQRVLWKSMPDAAAPVDPESKEPWYSANVWSKLRLSSKSHWDVPIEIGNEAIHILASHPTPPAFDGPEDRNGKRNHDEIRFWADYLSEKGSDWIVDDKGESGGLAGDANFAILGDLNADPVDGGSHQQAIRQILRHPRVNAAASPQSGGAREAAQRQGKANDRQTASPAYDTADFSDWSVGNLRVDYVLPSLSLTVENAGVFWPRPDAPLHQQAKSTDHHLVWIDIRIPAAAAKNNQTDNTKE